MGRTRRRNGRRRRGPAGRCAAGGGRRWRGHNRQAGSVEARVVGYQLGQDPALFAAGQGDVVPAAGVVAADELQNCARARART